VTPGTPGWVGTETDTLSGDLTVTPAVPGYHPKMTYPLPYLWKILSVEDVAR
jgi:hypothetical protein